MIPEGTDASAVTTEQIEDLRSDVVTFCRAHSIKYNQLATSVGYGHATISEFLKGTYRGAAAKVALDLQQWLVAEEERRQRPATTQFVWTNVAIQIKAVANYCVDKRTIGLVYGLDTSGVGKTMALQAIHQEIGPRQSALCTIDKVDANPTGLLKKLAAALHMGSLGTNKRRYDDIVAKLKGRKHLLLIDQIHNLRHAKDDKPFYILADLYDATQAAQLWCGTADLVGYLNRQRQRQHDESLAQIRRRIFPRVDLMEMLESGGSDGKGQPLATIDQVREMFAKNKLKLSAAAVRFVMGLINTPDEGGIGICVRLVEYATMLAEMTPGVTSIDTPLLKQAMRHSMTTERATTVMQKVEEAETKWRSFASSVG
jgi:DNA transposition AAA+ family ATPase